MVLRLLNLLLSLFAAVFFSVATMLVVLQNAERLNLEQPINERSSHVRPTPAGGGLGIVAGTILGAALQVWQDVHVLLALVLATIVATVGFADDVRPLSARLRLGIQLGAVSLFVVSDCRDFLGNVADVWFLPGAILLILAGVWWVNLFNFMDGIDGYAGSQAVFMLGAGALLSVLQGGALLDDPVIVAMLCVATATAGFLVFNWPPAKIFMGDAGSMFLGNVIFFLAVLSVTLGWLTFWQWIILGTVFLTDSTTTLANRIFERQNILQAHRNHAYQILSRRLLGHRPVTLMLWFFNLAVLLPVSLFARGDTWTASFPAILVIAIFSVASWIVSKTRKA